MSGAPCENANPAAPAAGAVLCRLDDLKDPGARGFSWRRGDSLFNGFLVRRGDAVFGYVDRCPHAGWPLSLDRERYLTQGGRAILCQVHGALFDPVDGRCIAGPGQGDGLTPWLVEAGDDGLVRTL